MSLNNEYQLSLCMSASFVLDTQQDDHDIHFFPEMASSPFICSCYGSIKGDFVGYSRDLQLFMDIPMYGKASDCTSTADA